MNHRKWVYNFFFFALAIIGIIYFVILVVSGD